MTNKHMRFTPLFAILLAFLWFACNKSTPFGADLLDDQLADYKETDTTTVRYILERDDSIITSDRSFTSPFFLCGELNDPVFGKSVSEINTLFRPGGTEPKFLKTAVIDSMVLFLRYAPSGVYGDTTQALNLAVYQLDQQIFRDSTYYSIRNLPATRKIGELNNFLPRPNKKDSLSFPNNKDSLVFAKSKAAFLRVRLDQSFAQDITKIDSAGLATQDTFFRRIRGLKIQVKNSGTNQPGCMLAFDLNDDNTDGSYYSFMRVFYREDTTKKVYDYFFARTNKFTRFKHDYTGSEVAPLIGKEVTEKLYLQGMGGLRLKAEFPYAHLWERIAVNKAFLEHTVASSDNTSSLLPASQLAILENSGDTLKVFSPDVTYSLGFDGTFSIFGGIPVEETINGTKVKRYRMNMVQRFQDYIDGDGKDPKSRSVYITVQPPNRSAMRTIINGPKSTTFPAKLQMTYTLIK
jgi:Domain of unknown function (DUF4270)